MVRFPQAKIVCILAIVLIGLVPASQVACAARPVLRVYTDLYGYSYLAKPLAEAIHLKLPNIDVKVDVFRDSLGTVKGPNPADWIADIQNGKYDLVVGDLPYLARKTQVVGNIWDNLLSLDELLRRDRIDLSGFYNLPKLLLHNGHQYDLPLVVHPLISGYNRDLTKESGLDDPLPGWTWSDFRRYAKTLTRSTAEPPIYGTALRWDMINVMLRQLNPDPRLLKPTDYELMIDAVDTLYHQDRSAFLPPSSLGPALGLVNKKLVAMDINVPTQLFSGGTGDIQFGVAQVPKWSDRYQGSIATVYSVAITATGNKLLAWEAVKSLLCLESAVTIARFGQFPAFIHPKVLQAWLTGKQEWLGMATGLELVAKQPMMLRERTEESSLLMTSILGLMARFLAGQLQREQLLQQLSVLK